MKSTKVSICIPAYQAPDLLRRTLQSVFTQSYENYEVIVTDDSSEYSVRDIIKEYETDSRLKYYRNSERKGTPENWNEAIRRATGEYVKILHHDDWFSRSDSLRKYVDLLNAHPLADIAFSASAAYTREGTLLSVNKPTPRQIENLRRNPSYLYPDNIIGAPSATIYRRAVKTVFDVKLKWVVDMDFYIRTLAQNGTVAYCEEPLVNVNAGSADQVTSLCQDDSTLQLFEWLYLYKRLHAPLRPRQLQFLWALFKKYEIRSAEELYTAGVEPPLPSIVKVFLLLRNVLR